MKAIVSILVVIVVIFALYKRYVASFEVMFRNATEENIYRHNLDAQFACLLITWPFTKMPVEIFGSVPMK